LAAIRASLALVYVRLMGYPARTMTLDEFVQKIEDDPPPILTLSDLAKVRPKPWVLRAGPGKDARIRMLVGSVRYEREQGEHIWHRSDLFRSDLDTLDAA